MKKNLIALFIVSAFASSALAADLKSMTGRFSLEANSPRTCIDQTLSIGSGSDSSVFIEGFALNWLTNVNEGWQTDSYDINLVKVTFDGVTLTKEVRGVEGIETTTWTLDKDNQHLIVNQYSYGRLSNTCSFTRAI